MPIDGDSKEKIKRIRKSLGLTIEDFALKLKMPVGTYKKYEYGERPIPPWFFMLIEHVEQNEILQSFDTRKIVVYIFNLLLSSKFTPEQISGVLLGLIGELKLIKDHK